NHSAAMHRTHLAASRGADQHAIPLSTSVAAARGSVACHQSAIDRPWQLAASTGERAAVDGTAGHQRAAWLAVGARLLRLLGSQRALACLFGLARLAGQGFLDGLEYAPQFGLLLLARLEALVTTGEVAVELGQCLLALLAHLGELGVTFIQVRLLCLQLGLVSGDFLLDVGQLAQGLVESRELLQACLTEVVVVGEGARELFRVLLVEQQLDVFLAAALIGGAGLDGDQSLLLSARALEFFFLLIQALDFLLAALEFALQFLDLMLQVAHLGLGLLQLLLHAGFLLLQLLQQLLQLGDVLAGGFQLALGIGALIGDGRSDQAAEQNQGKDAKHGRGDTWRSSEWRLVCLKNRRQAASHERQAERKCRVARMQFRVRSADCMRATAAASYSSSTMVLPVISAGCSRPISLSRVGATSASTPPSRMRAGRLPT